MFIKKATVILLTVLFFAACGSDKSYSTEATATGTDTSSDSDTEEDVYSSDTEDLTEDASEEVSEEEACQSEEPDFDAIKEKLVEKLTSLLEKLNGVDTSEFSEEQLAFHNEFVAKVESDLAIVNASTELTDELKQIARKVWRPYSHGPRRGPHHGGQNQCRSTVENSMREKHCSDLEKILATEGLSDELKEIIQSRYDQFCSSSEEE